MDTGMKERSGKDSKEIIMSDHSPAKSEQGNLSNLQQ